MDKMNEKDKQVIKEYLEKNKKSGKTDEQVIKQASNQATLFMGFMFIVIITLIFAILVLNGIEVDHAKNKALNFL